MHTCQGREGVKPWKVKYRGPSVTSLIRNEHSCVFQRLRWIFSNRPEILLKHKKERDDDDVSCALIKHVQAKINYTGKYKKKIN